MRLRLRRICIQRSQGGCLTRAALLAGAIFVAGHAYWFWLTVVASHLDDVVLRPGAARTLLGVFVYFPMYLIRLLLLIAAGSAIRYTLIAAVCAALCAAAWQWGKPSRLARIGLMLVPLTVVGLPWTIRYEPMVAPAPGHVMHVPTAPRGRIEGMARAIAQSVEVIPCTFGLLEWSEDGTLYFQSDCVRSPFHSVWGSDGSSAVGRVWAFNPDQGGLPRTAGASSTRLTRESMRGNYHWDVPVTGLVTVPPHHSILKSTPSPSPDGRWVAVVVCRDYVPEDIVVVSQ